MNFSELITSAENGYAHYKTAFEKLADYYLANMDKATLDSLTKRDKSRIFFPVVSTKAKRVLASFQEAYFSNEEFASVAPELDDIGLDELAEALQKALNYYTTKKMHLFGGFDEIFLSAIVYGTAICKVFWHESKPRIDRLNIDEVFFDPNARSFEDLRYVVEVVYQTEADIRALQERGVYRDDFSASELTRGAGALAQTRYSKIKLYDLYFLEDGNWYLTTLHEKTNIIRNPTPLKDGLPIFAGYLIPQLFKPDDYNVVRVYGDSPIASIVPLQHEMNARRNQQIDAISLQLAPRVVVGVGTGINPFDLKKGAGAVIKANNPAGLNFLPPPNLQQSVFDVSRLDTEIQEAIGVTAYNSGIDQSQMNATATGISILSQEANTRIQAYIRAFNETFVEPVFRHLCKLILKYGDDSFFKGVNRNVEFDFTVSVNTGIGATNKQIQLNGLQQAYSMFMQLQDTENARRVLKQILPILGIKNTKEYFRDDETTESGITKLGGEQRVGVDDGNYQGTNGNPIQGGAQQQQQPYS